MFEPQGAQTKDAMLELGLQASTMLQSWERPKSGFFARFFHIRYVHYSLTPELFTAMTHVGNLKFPTEAKAIPDSDSNCYRFLHQYRHLHCASRHPPICGHLPFLRLSHFPIKISIHQIIKKSAIVVAIKAVKLSIKLCLPILKYIKVFQAQTILSYSL